MHYMAHDVQAHNWTTLFNQRLVNLQCELFLHHALHFTDLVQLCNNLLIVFGCGS